MKVKNMITTILSAAFLFGMSAWCIFGETPNYSDSERRVLAEFPEVTSDEIMSGKFATEFEEYAVDRFPARDAWRTIKAYVKTYAFMQKDNNKIFVADGHISKLEYPMNQEMLDYALNLFAKIKDKYLGENKVYVSVIPDKNRFMAEANGYLSIDYAALSEYVKNGMDYAEYIEIADLLELDDYYNTDTHWRQDKIVDVAQRIASAMGTELTADYTENKLTSPFNGVYVGQSALAFEPDKITYLTNDVLSQVEVEGAKAVYDLTKATGKDPYEMFLSGNQPIVTMKNNESNSGKRLIVFRDSFGSSIAPLFAEGYDEVVLIDLRYISSSMLEQYVDFGNADVLFLYSTLLLNNSLALR